MRAITTIGVASGSFKSKSPNETTLLVATALANFRITRIAIARIRVDGMDSTGELLKALGSAKADAILLDGICHAGFNVLDARAIWESKGIPVIIISEEEPDMPSVRRALEKHFPDWRERWRAIRRSGKPSPLELREGEAPIYFKAIGMGSDRAKALIRYLSVNSKLPEPIRVSKLIARGLTSPKQ
jgi:endonuclease V-like protein UPF0215 family